MDIWGNDDDDDDDDDDDKNHTSNDDKKQLYWSKMLVCFPQGSQSKVHYVLGESIAKICWGSLNNCLNQAESNGFSSAKMPNQGWIPAQDWT